jgi:putative SOS response-associated peptidase YedK
MNRPNGSPRHGGGLIPYWAKDKKIGASLINARAETVAVKPAFRTAFKKRRCLIPAAGVGVSSTEPVPSETDI